jgi:hypothetical protein
MSDDEATPSDGPVPVGVKLGSTRTVIALPDGEGGLETIRTLTCLATYEDQPTGEARVLYGDEAATEYPDRAEFMLRSGLPEDDELVTRDPWEVRGIVVHVSRDDVRDRPPHGRRLDRNEHVVRTRLRNRPLREFEFIAPLSIFPI